MRLGWLLLLVLCAPLAADPVPLPLAVPADVYRDYECWLGKRTLATISDYRGPCLRRDVVEVALFQQALIAAGYAHAPQWEIINSYQRTLLELSHGKLPAAATSLWLKDIEATPGLTASRAVLPVGSNLDHTAVPDCFPLAAIWHSCMVANRWPASPPSPASSSCQSFGSSVPANGTPTGSCLRHYPMPSCWKPITGKLWSVG